MKISEIKKKNIEKLKNDYANLEKLQTYLTMQTDDKNKNVIDMMDNLESNADMNTPIRYLCASTAETTKNEIARLEKLIDDAEINI